MELSPNMTKNGVERARYAPPQFNQRILENKLTAS